jgi:predicted TPR repeat methyltransferase
MEADFEHHSMTNDPFPPEAVRLCDEGYALLEAGQVDASAAALLRARALAPDSPLAHYRLGLLYSDIGRPAEAVTALDVVIALQPDNARAHNNRGSALQLLGRAAEAETAFRAAIALAPDLEVPHVNLGKLLELQGNTSAAVDVYKRAIASGLESPVIRHNLAAASGQVAARAPAGYVRETFDNFAPLFDERLRELGYDAPRALAALILAHTSGPLDILDLGCGTGQCGKALESIRRWLVGIDLSEKMMVHARLLGIYDELRVADLQDGLAGVDPASFDLAIAGDVFIYLGALEDAFREVARLVRRGGWFAFSTEECSDRDYVLLPSGRFAQAEAYIRRLAQRSFNVVVAQPTVIRLESGVPLPGRLYLLQRR